MQNVQNAEIQQRVINLVELYRTKVGKESQIAKDAKADDEFWLQESIDMMEGDGFTGGGLYGEGPHTEIWIKHLMVNEQLLGHFYALVAGENAEKEILDQLLPDVYDKNIFTEEEEAFLASHFKEMVNYIILTPCDESLDWVNRHDSKNAYTIPDEVLNLIKSRVKIAEGSRIYYPNTIFAQLANLFDECLYYCDTMFYAWTRVAIYANSIVTDVLDNGSIPPTCDAIVSYLAKVSDDSNILTKIKEAYKSMSTGGKLILLCPNEFLWKKNTDKDNCPQEELRKQLVLENSIIEIIQLPSVMSPNLDTRNWCLLIAEKGHDGKYSTLIDARFAFKDTKYSLSDDDFKAMGEDTVGRLFTRTESGRILMTSGPFGTALDTNALNAMIGNKGFSVKEGLRKMVHVDKAQLDSDNLIPQIYVIERPTPDQKPIPLDSICQIITSKVRSLDFDLPQETPWIKEHDLSSLFHGALDITTLEKANCPNNPPHDSNYEFDKEGKFVEDSFHYLLGWGSPQSMRVAQYRACTYLDGKKDAAILYQEQNDVKTALCVSTDNPVVVEGEFVNSRGMLVFCPALGVDALTLIALLRMPIVCRQIQAYEPFELHRHLKDILVPWDKLLISDEKKKLLKEEVAFKAQKEKYDEMKTEYINEVRMRKHDMGQYIFELMNIEDLMRYYLDNKNNEKNFLQQIRKLLDNFRDSLRELSTMLDNLSKEELFGLPEPIDIQDFLLKLEHRHQADGYKILTILDLRALRDYRDKIAKAMGISVSLEDNDSTVPMIYISRNDLQRMVNNILDNANKHGFTDPNRKDYEIQVWVSIDADKRMFQFDFRNNGNPLPEGMNKMRYGIKGEKAGQTGGTGLGGNYVKSFVEHYGGDYDIFMENGWTVVRIYLPIK